MSKKVLIIDDSATDAALIKDLMAQEGLEPYVAATGEDGVKQAMEIKPDLILLDLMMPGISGFEVCSKIKQEESLRNTIVLVLSAKDDMDDITHAFQVKADDYIIKPPMPEFLVKKVKLYLGIK